MPSIGNLTAHITADTSGLTRGTKRATSTLGGISKKMGSVAAGAAAMGAAATAAGAAVVAGLAKSGLKAVDAQYSLARSLNGTIDGVKALQDVASDAGIDGMEASLSRLNRRLGDAENASGPAAKAVDRLGLNAKELGQLDTDERVAAIADAIKESGMSSQESARQLQRLGFRQREANNLFRQGGDVIRDARKGVEDYGRSLSEVDAAKVEQANKAFGAIGDVIEVIRERLAVQLAPYLEFIADLIDDAARESNGFRGAIDAAITGAIRITAKLADVVDVVKRGIVVAGQGAKVAGLAIARSFLQAGNTILKGPVNAINKLISAYNKIPGLPDIEGLAQPGNVEAMQSTIDSMTDSVADGRQIIEDTLNKPLPSSGIEKKMDEIKAKSEEAAQKVVEEREKMDRAATAPAGADIDAEGGEGAGAGVGVGAGASPGVEQSGDKDAGERHKAQLQGRLDRIREHLMSRLEAEQQAHQERREWLEEAREEDMVTDQEYKEIKQQLEQKHQHALNKIEKDGLNEREKFERASMKKRVSTVASQLGNMTSDVARENKAMFNLNKAAAIATATVEGIKGAEKTWNAYPYPYNIPMTAAHVASSAARLSQLKSSSFSGGGGSATTSGGGGGGATSAPSEDSGQGTDKVTGSSTSVDVNLVGGDEVLRKNARTMIEALNDAIGDGARLNIRG